MSVYDTYLKEREKPEEEEEEEKVGFFERAARFVLPGFLERPLFGEEEEVIPKPETRSVFERYAKEKGIEIEKPKEFKLEEYKGPEIVDRRKEPLWRRVAKWVLPEKAEEFFGLDISMPEKTIQQKMMEREEDRTRYLIERGKIKDIALSRHTKNFIIGIGGTVEGMIGAGEWIAPDSMKPFFKEKGDQVELWKKKMLPEDRKFVDDLVAGAGSVVTFFIPGIGVAKAASVLAKISPKLAFLFGNVVATALESATEAGFIYREKKGEGADEKEASWAATKTFIANSILIGLTNKFGVFSDKTTSIMKRMLVSAPMEGLQEYFQEVIQNVNMGKPAFQNALKSGAIGALLGIGMGGISGTVFNNLPTEEQRKIIEEELLSKAKKKEVAIVELKAIPPKELVIPGVPVKPAPLEVKKPSIEERPTIKPKIISEGVIEYPTLYHGTTQKGLTELLPDVSKRIVFGAKPAVSVTENPLLAKSFTRGELGDQAVGEVIAVKGPLKIIDITTPKGKALWESLDREPKKALEAGYDGIQHPNYEKIKIEAFYKDIDWSKVKDAHEIQLFRKVATEAIKPEVEPKERPEGKPTKVAKSIEAKARERGIVEGFEGLAEYSPVVIKEQMALIETLMAENIDKAKRMATGEETLDPEIKGAMLIKMMEDYAMENNDGELIMALANSPLVSETSEAGQTLRLIRERVPDSATAKIQEVKKEREEVAKKKMRGKTKTQVKEGIKKDLTEKLAKDRKKIGKHSWQNLIREIAC